MTFDQTTLGIAEFVTGLQHERLAPRTVHATHQRVIDTLACALGGVDSPPAEIARRLAARQPDPRGASVFGLPETYAPEAAAFANAIIIRFLDYNDGYLSIGAVHPSDALSAIFAAAEMQRCDGRTLIVGIVAGYEVLGALCDVTPLRDRGWDQGIGVALMAAVGAARVLGLSTEQTCHAISLAVVPNVAVRVTRAGELSMWKGAATSVAAKAGLFAVLLAAEGMTAPGQAFEGRHGIFEQVTGPIRFELPTASDTAFRVERSNLKFFPIEGHAQAPVGTMLELRKQFAVEDVERVDVVTYWNAYHEIASEPEKWDPRTRETADHSLPYLLAVAMRDGPVTTAHFADAAITDPELRPLMQRIRVAPSEELTAQFPRAMLSDIAVTTRAGRRFSARTGYPRGHHLNPMTDAEIEHKFLSTAAGAWEPARARSMLDALWQLDQAADVSTLLRQFR